MRFLKDGNPRRWRCVIPNHLCRDNYLRAVEFRRPAWIPCAIHIFPAVWAKYGEALRAVAVRHPFVFGRAIQWTRARFLAHIPAHQRAGAHYYDNWGCGWRVARGGYQGQVVEHPLADWAAFDRYEFPDPLKFTERGRRVWFGIKWGYRVTRPLGILSAGTGERLFDRLYFLRGFDNLMRDFARRDPRLPKLVQRLQDHEMALTRNWLEKRVDFMYYHTDIGTQDRLMISPRDFRTYLKPMFRALFQTCRRAGTHVYLSSDGYLLDIVDDLVECGVSVHDPQERANTLAGIAEHYTGKLCVDLDLDRQGLPFESPDAIKARVQAAVEVLGAPEGGLMMKAEVADPNVPLRNINALCEAFEEYSVLEGSSF